MMNQTTISQTVINQTTSSPTAISQNGHTPKIDPSSGVLDELSQIASTQDHRAYRRLIDKVDWDMASAEELDKGISVMLGFVDTRRSKVLAEMGLEKYPDYEVFTRIQPIFNPRPARVAKLREKTPKPRYFLKNSMEWIIENQDEYEVGHWLAVNNGVLVADSPSCHELSQMLDTMRTENNPLTDHILVHQII
ncbi:MAG: hypothetical protein AAF639_27705 [Chloroflexota bacterium]